MIVNYNYENNYQMELNNKTLERVRVIKYLGVLIQYNIISKTYVENKNFSINPYSG
jgi:hypothetical protein